MYAGYWGASMLKGEEPYYVERALKRVAALENEMKTNQQFISSKAAAQAAAQAAALLATPAQPRQHREARRLLRAWQQQQSQPRLVAR